MKRLILLMILLLTSCGGSDGPVEPPPPVSLAVSMSAELYQTLENGDCDFDIVISAKGDGEATWTGLGIVWYIEPLVLPDSRDAQWVAGWLEAASLRAPGSVTGAIITLPDSLYMVLRYRTDAGRADSASVMLRCPVLDA